MKVKIKLIIIGIVSTLIFSCSDFLERHPLDQISSEEFWTSKEDAEMALTGVYSRLQCNTYYYARMAWDVLAGDVYNIRGDNWGVRAMSQGLIEETSSGLVQSVYTDCYKGIAACNFFLTNIDKVIDINSALKDQFKGEALFLRALHYFTLTEFYGGVPLYTEPPTIEGSMVKKYTKEAIIEQVLEDLDFAILHLPNTQYSGHAVKGSALALKAKVLLHNERWSEAAEAANQVISDGVFHLYDNFPNLFLTIGQKDNPEIMFSTQYLLPNNYVTNAGYNITMGKECKLNPYQEFVDCFECRDGLPISESSLYDPENYKANRDPRMNYTVKPWGDPVIRSDGYEWFNVETSETDYSVIKYLDPEAVPWDYTANGDQDHIILRYSDVLLMYSEAKNEVLNSPDESVYAAINEVRARPSVEMPPLPQGLNKAEMRQRIMQERRVEFGLEGMRYHDLKRWKTIEEILPKVIDAGTKKPLVFEAPKHYLLPFPRAELDINPNLEQNPGY